MSRIYWGIAGVGADPPRARVLDFGCGVGRLSAALATRFGQVDGVDVSSKMIAAARASVPLANATFHENRAGDLSLFAGGSFDFVLSLIVLQHIPPPHGLRYVSEFARVLRQGGVACFQFPTAPKRWLSRRRLKTHVRRVLFRVPGARSVWRAVRGELPIEMYGLSARAVTDALARGGVEVVLRVADEAAGEDWHSVRFICRKR